MTREEKNGFSYRIMQASPTELIVILYEMAETYLRQSVDKLNEGEIAGFRMNLKYAGRVINELNRSLDLRYDISLNFMQIYIYMNRAMIRASVSKKPDELLRCMDMLNKLKKSFEQIRSEDKRGPVMENTQQVYAGLTYSKGTLNESFGPESNRGFRV